MTDPVQAPPDEPIQDGYIETEQLRMLFAHTAAGSVIATCFALLLARHLSGTIGDRLLVAWVVLKVAIAVPRILQAMVFRRSGTANPKRCVFWADALLLVDGLVWGLGGLCFTQGTLIEAVVVAACLCCVACVGTFGLQVRFKATAAYVVPTIGFTIVGLARLGGDFGYMSATGLAMALALMLSTAAKSERRLAEVFRLRQLAQQISQERAAALLSAKLESDRKSRFVATVSHEIRTPLHGMLGLAALLREGVPGRREQEQVDLITAGGHHLLRLVNDLLDLAKFESGTLRFERSVFSLPQELEQLSTVYAARASQAGVHLHTRFSLPAPLWVEADAGRLRQVLDNLMGNALKFTPPGGSVALVVARAADDEVSFAVTDTGPGIAPDELARLFVPYQQVSDEKKAREGTGLGLAIARELATLMGGAIDCESEVGKGSTFRVRLPMPAVAAPARLPAAPAAPAVPRRAGNDLILLADDDEVSALVAVAALEQAGWRVDTVTHGEAALDYLKRGEGRPGLVLMDCDMPGGIDGLEATRRIRQWEEEHQAPRPMAIVALTGRASRSEHKECLAAGMDQVLTKPFSMAALVAAVDRLLVVDGAERTADAAAAKRRADAGLGLSAFGMFDGGASD